MEEDKNNFVLAADIGGSHITTALVNLSTQEILQHTFIRKRLNSNASAEDIISSWCLAINETLVLGDKMVKYFGFAMPGPFDYENGISKMKDNAKFESLYNLNVKNLLAAKLTIQPSQIKMMNDAGCFLRGEVFCGAAQGFEHAIGITLGTGLGSAKYHNGNAEDADMWCIPFKNSIAEDYISTRWFVSRYRELTDKTVKDVKELISLDDYDEIIPFMFKEFGENLAIFLNEFIQQENPDIVILGGNIAHAYSLFESSLKGSLPEIELKVSKLGETATLLGAGSLWELECQNN